MPQEVFVITEQYIGVYSYQSDEPGDLTFNVGEIVTVTKKDGDWWTGQIGDRSGIFPANYVKVHEVQVGLQWLETLTFIYYFIKLIRLKVRLYFIDSFIEQVLTNGLDIFHN